MNPEGELLDQVRSMMGALEEAQSGLDDLEVEGTAGGGLVRVVASGRPEVRRIDIAPEALEDPEMLGDLIAAAVNDALRHAAREAQQRLGGLAGGLELP